ncbi:MAG: Stp1/IreP family PP2C-type Ser/Thr phosphatase [Allobaculum sp.]
MLEVYGLSDIGKARQLNEDSFLICENENHDQLLMVCDGIGGAASGEVASGMTCELVEKYFEKAPAFLKDYEVDEWLRRTLSKVNDAIYSKSMWTRKNRGMGTTCVGTIITKIGTYIFNAGDSRLYALYSDGLIQMSEDHSYVQNLINEKKLSEADARYHEKRSVLTNAIGVWRTFKLDVQKIQSNYKALLLCSDGLSSYVSERKIARIVDAKMPLKTKCAMLIDLADEAGGLDNCTVIVTGPGKYYAR